MATGRPRPHSTPSECLATCEAAARFRFYALLRGLADIYAVESCPVILVNERKALTQCHVSCNMKSPTRPQSARSGFARTTARQSLIDFQATN